MFLFKMSQIARRVNIRDALISCHGRWDAALATPTDVDVSAFLLFFGSASRRRLRYLVCSGGSVLQTV